MIYLYLAYNNFTDKNDTKIGKFQWIFEKIV